MPSSGDGTLLEASKQAPAGVPSVIAPERFEKYFPGLEKDLLTLIWASAEIEMAQVSNTFGPLTPPAL